MRATFIFMLMLSAISFFISVIICNYFLIVINILCSIYWIIRLIILQK